MKNKIIGIILIIMVWGYGVIVGKNHIFPYEQIKTLKNLFISVSINTESKAFDNPNNNTDLPNVLIIGDSISIGYTNYVRTTLQGRADIFRIPENSRHTYYGIRKLKEWLGNKKWDIIHFNWGLWDIRYDGTTSNNPKGIKRSITEEYRNQIETLVILLKKTNAKLIWCSSTPVPKGLINRNSGDEVKYNEIAKQIMIKYNIQINNLYEYAIPNISDIQLEKNVHFSENGSKYLAEKVSKEIIKALN